MDLRWFDVPLFVTLCLTISVDRTVSQTNAKTALQSGMYV